MPLQQLSGARQHRPPSAEGSVLSQVLRPSRSRDQGRIVVPHRVRRVLWLLTLAQLAWTGWLSVVAAGSVRWSGPTYQVVTLNGHVSLLLVFAAVSLVGLTLLAASTRGFASARAGQVTGVVLAVLSAGVALLGIVALVMVVGIVLLLLTVLFGTLTVTW